MRFSLKTKFITLCIILIVLTVLGISGTYYVLTRRLVQRQSRQQIQIAFGIMFDDLTNRIDTYREKFEEFLQQDKRLNGTAYLYLQEDDRLSSTRSIGFHLTTVTTEFQKAEQIISADRLLLYGQDRRLMVVYQRVDNQETIGGYVVSQTGKDTYLPMDDPSLQTKLLDGQPIADMPLPPDIAGQYPEELPDEISVALFSDNMKLGFRIIAPVYYIEKKIGVLIGDFFSTQSTVARYAALSKTAVNLFVGNQIALGTFTLQTHLELDVLTQLVSCDEIAEQKAGMEILSLTFEDQNYYQGQCALKNPQGTIGAVTISLPQQIEQQEVQKMLMAIVIVSVIAIGIAIGLSILFSRTSIRSIQNIVNVIGSVANGDLRETAIDMTRDELGILVLNLNQMITHLRMIVGQVQHSGVQVTSSSTELSATAREQEAIMTHQVEAANKVVHSVKEISDVAMHLVETMQHVAAMSQEAAGLADSSQSDLLRMEDAMRQMEDASKSISGRLQTISEKAENITTVVTTINKVAEQTNLLSLNASIEAEKAGEYGRGFTVVAREIRRLADQTAVATLDIDQMVQEMQSAVSSGIMEMDKFIADVRHSAENVGKISMQLTLIIDQVQALTPNFEEVNVAMSHQSGNAQKINGEIMSLSEELQQTKDSLHETYAVIEQLNEAAKGLKEQVSRFKVN